MPKPTFRACYPRWRKMVSLFPFAVMADLVPHRASKRNIKPHPVMGKIKINYDPTEPLAPEELGSLKDYVA